MLVDQAAEKPSPVDGHVIAVELCINKLRRFRAAATRYDKREGIYQGTLDLASIGIWLRDPVR